MTVINEALSATDRLREEVHSLHWFHSIDFGGGIISPGHKSVELLAAEAEAYFSHGIQDKSFLDIGCWDGANSLAAWKRGARRIVATDHYVWHHGANRRCCELMRLYIAPSIEIMDIDLLDLTPERVGRFDVVLFAGVLYHLKHPLHILEQVAKLALEHLIIETHLDALDYPRPAMVFYPGAELLNDPTNWWGPNPSCVKSMLQDVGFSKIEYRQHPIVGQARGIFHAFQKNE